MQLNRGKAALMVAKGLAASALPYLPDAAKSLHDMGVDPRVVSVVAAAAMIYKAFKVDPATGKKPVMPQSTDVQTTEATNNDLP